MPKLNEFIYLEVMERNACMEKVQEKTKKKIIYNLILKDY